MTSEIVYEFARKLKSAKNIAEKFAILIDDDIYKFRSEASEFPAQVWIAVNESGLFEQLLTDLTKPSNDPIMFARFFSVAAYASQLCLCDSGRVKMTTAQRNLVIARVPVIFRRAVETIQDLTMKHANDPKYKLKIAMLNHGTSNLIGLSYRGLGFDRVLVNSIDAQELLGIAIATLFDHDDLLPQDCVDFAVGGCALVLCPDSVQDFAYANPQSTIIQELMGRHTPEHIAASCHYMWTITDDNKCVQGLSNLFVLLHHGNTPALHRAFIEKSVWTPVIQGLWKMFKTPGTSEALILEQLLMRKIVIDQLARDVVAFGGTSARNTVSRAFAKLLVDADLLLFISKLYLVSNAVPFQTYPDALEIACDLKNWGGWIADACKIVPSLMDDHCRPMWKHIMQRLLALDRSKPMIPGAFDDPGMLPCSKIWQQLGQHIRLSDPTDISTDPHWTPRSTMIQLPCSWVRCPLNGAVEVQQKWDMLRCADCRKVQYCGAACQKFDWASKHRTECIGSE